MVPKIQYSRVIFFSGILSATKLTTENIVLRSLTPITPHFVDLFGFCIEKKKGKKTKEKNTVIWSKDN